MNKKSKKKLAVPIELEEYEFGSIVNPAVDLTENQIAWSKAKDKASRNGWAMGTKIFGNLAMQVGTSMMNQGMSQGEGKTEGGFNWGNLMASGINGMGAYANTQGAYATGGTVGAPTPINAEGDEVIETPDGTMGVLDGPSHAEGGIDMVVPSGTEIFSKKLIGQDGKTMAQRKIDREKRISKIQKQLEKNPNDETLKRTLKRIQSNNERTEQEDLSVMQMAKMMSDMQKFATGGVAGWPPIDWTALMQSINPNINPTGTTDDYHVETPITDYSNTPANIKSTQYPSFGNNWEGTLGQDLQYPTTTYNPDNTPEANTGTTPKANNGFDWNGVLNLTAGDAIGLAGNYISTFGPKRNTERMRAGDTPNINPYENYGKEGLATLDKSKQFAAGVRDSQLQDLELTRGASIRRGRNSARGINTMRALDLATDAGVNNARQGVYNQYMQQIAAILSQQAGMENQQDQMVMQGNYMRDQNDRADRDAYFTALAQDIATMGTGLQKSGKDINQMKTRNVAGNILNQMYPNFEGDLMSGKISGKVTEEQVKSTSVYNNLSNDSLKQKYMNGILKNNYKWVDGKLYNKNGKELDITTLEPIE